MPVREKVMTEVEFNEARRAFIVVDRTLLIAPPRFPGSHREWLGWLVGSEKAALWIEDNPRGYALYEADHIKLHLYVGVDCSHRGITADDVDVAAKALCDRHRLLRIGLGAIAQPAGVFPWPARRHVSIFDVALAIEAGKGSESL